MPAGKPAGFFICWIYRTADRRRRPGRRPAEGVVFVDMREAGSLSKTRQEILPREAVFISSLHF